MEIYLFRFARVPAAPSEPSPCRRFVAATEPSALSGRVFLPLVLMLAPPWSLPGAMFSNNDQPGRAAGRDSGDVALEPIANFPAAKGSYLGYLAVTKAKRRTAIICPVAVYVVHSVSRVLCLCSRGTLGASSS
jgi:hypothetical protein